MNARPDDLDTHLQHLVGLEEALAGALDDSDPVLWAAHESVLCVRSLLNGSARGPEDDAQREDDLTAAMAQMRSAVTAIRIAATDTSHRATRPASDRRVGPVGKPTTRPTAGERLESGLSPAGLL